MTARKEVANVIALVDPIWEQQPKESVKNFARFMIYSDLPPVDRSYAAAWRAVRNGQGKAIYRCPDYFVELANVWRWKERAIARDKHLYEVNKENWLMRDDQRRREDYLMGQKIRDMAEAALDGVDLEKLSPMQAAKLALIGSQLQEVSLDGLRPQPGQIRDLLEAMPSEMRQKVVGSVLARLER